MRVSTAYKFAFVGNPKCGSTSIGAAIDDAIGRERPFQAKVGNHLSATEMRERLAAIGENWSDYYSFTTIRDPWRRVAAHFAHARRSERTIWRKALDEGETMRGFVRSNIFQSRARPLERMAFAPSGQCIVGDIFKLEEIEAALPRIECALGRPLRMPWLNASPQYDYRDLMDEESVETIRSVYRLDIEIGGYAF